MKRTYGNHLNIILVLSEREKVSSLPLHVVSEYKSYLIYVPCIKFIIIIFFIFLWHQLLNHIIYHPKTNHVHLVFLHH